MGIGVSVPQWPAVCQTNSGSTSENPEPMLFLEARDDVPLKSTFKPNFMVLARKPPQVLSRDGKTADDDDSEEERRKKNEASFKERQERAQIERAEKEKRYAEARERLFGSPATSEGSRGTSPNKNTRGKGRGRGGRDSRDNQARSSNEQSPARAATAGRQLYDPNYSPMPSSVSIQKNQNNGSQPETPNLEKPIREPRGPQTTGRGGRGFAPRGSHSGSGV